MLSWLDNKDPPGTFEALRRLCAKGMGKDDGESLMLFMDLVCNNPDFETGRGFWSNVYKLWLLHYAQLSNQDFQTKIKNIIQDFNEKREAEGLSATYRGGPLKSYARMRAREKELKQNASFEKEEPHVTTSR